MTDEHPLENMDCNLYILSYLLPTLLQTSSLFPSFLFLYIQFLKEVPLSAISPTQISFFTFVFKQSDLSLWMLQLFLYPLLYKNASDLLYSCYLTHFNEYQQNHSHPLSSAFSKHIPVKKDLTFNYLIYMNNVCLLFYTLFDTIQTLLFPYTNFILFSLLSFLTQSDNHSISLYAPFPSFSNHY